MNLIDQELDIPIGDPAISTARALEIVLSRLKMDEKTADVLRAHLAWQRAKDANA